MPHGQELQLLLPQSNWKTPSELHGPTTSGVETQALYFKFLLVGQVVAQQY